MRIVDCYFLSFLRVYWLVFTQVWPWEPLTFLQLWPWRVVSALKQTYWYLAHNNQKFCLFEPNFYSDSSSLVVLPLKMIFIDSEVMPFSVSIFCFRLAIWLVFILRWQWGLCLPIISRLWDSLDWFSCEHYIKQILESLLLICTPDQNTKRCLSEYLHNLFVCLVFNAD